MTLLGIEPYADAPYYVGFNVKGQEIGLDPTGHTLGIAGLVGYRHVDDIRTTLPALLDAGAAPKREVTDVGGGKPIASVREANGNVVGLVQSA